MEQSPLLRKVILSLARRRAQGEEGGDESCVIRVAVVAVVFVVMVISESLLLRRRRRRRRTSAPPERWGVAVAPHSRRTRDRPHDKFQEPLQCLSASSSFSSSSSSHSAGQVAAEKWAPFRNSDCLLPHAPQMA